MYNYHEDLVWKLDLFLLYLSIGLSFLIIVYIRLKDILNFRRSKALQELKKHVYELTFSAQASVSAVTPAFIKKASARQFLEVTTNINKEEVFFNEAEQMIFKESFLSADKIKDLKKVASGSYNKWRRIEAILSLGYANISAAVSIIKKGLQSRDEDVVYFSLLALSQIRSEESAKELLGFLKRNSTYRYKIVSILANFPSESVKQLESLLKDKDQSVRFWALKIVSRMKYPANLKDIETLVDDESAEVRAASCECLGELGRPEAKAALTKCLKDNYWLSRANAIRALSKILGKDSIKEIIKSINDGSLSVIDAVKEALVNNITAAIPYIEELLASQDGVARRCAVEALETSGYLKQTLNTIALKDPKQGEKARQLLELVVKSSAHFGLESALMDFKGEARKRLLDIIGSVDPMLAEHIDKKIKGPDIDL